MDVRVGADPMTGLVAANAGVLLRTMRDGVPRTRSELGRITGLARSTITQHLDLLVESDLIAVAGAAASTGGRPPRRYALKPDARLVAAADIGATHARIAITDLSTRVLAERRSELDVAAGPLLVLDRVVDVVCELLEQVGRTVPDLVGIGVGLPGPVEHVTGTPVSPPIMPGWDGFRVPDYLKERLGRKALVDNDVNIMALGEHFIEWRGFPNMMLVKVATGIGCGLISDGRLHRGAQGAAGDLGHLQLPRGDDVVCRCGNTGCLEAVASGAAIAAALSEQGIAASSSRDVVELARGGCMEALQLVRQAGRDIGEVLAAAVSLFNPSVIVIGGSLSQVEEHLIAGVHENVYRRSLPLATQHLRVVKSRMGDRAGIIGAAAMVIDDFLAPTNGAVHS